MSVAAELGKENPSSRRQVIRSQPLSLMMMNRQNNCPNSHMNEDRIESRRRVWRLDSETEVDLILQRDQNRSCREVIRGEIVEALIVLPKGTTHQVNSKINLDLV